MFAVFGKVRAEEEKRRRLVYDKLQSKWYEDSRQWKRLSNSRYQISPEYSSIDTAEEFIRLSSGNPDIHIVGIRQLCNAMNLHCDDVALQELRFKSDCDPYLKGVESIDENQAVEILDSLCDQIVTAIGVGYMMGFDMVGALQEVNLSNWSKFDENGNPIFNENGKIVKGENYFKPDLAKFLKAGENE